MSDYYKNTTQDAGWRDALTGWMMPRFGHQRPETPSRCFSSSTLSGIRITRSSVRLRDSLVRLVYVPIRGFPSCCSPLQKNKDPRMFIAFLRPVADAAIFWQMLSHWLRAVHPCLCNRRDEAVIWWGVKKINCAPDYEGNSENARGCFFLRCYIREKERPFVHDIIYQTIVIIVICLC